MNSATYVRPGRRSGFMSALWPTAKETGNEFPTLTRCGLALLFCFMVLVFLPDPFYSASRFFLNPLTALWVGLSLIKTRCRLRFTFPYYMLLLMQVWMVISMIATQTYITKYWGTGEYLWYPVEVGIPYVLCVVLLGLSPSISRYIINFFILLCGISAFIAILQAVHFGPAIHVADYYVYRSIEGWGNVAGIRSSGLSNNPNNLVLCLAIAACLIAYKSSLRRLHWFDWTLWGMFLAASFAAQHRSSMPILAVTFIATGLVMGRKRPRTLAFLFGGAALCLVMAMTVGKHTFAYVFETDWSNSSELEGRIDEERSAYAMAMKYPVFGIGPAPAPEAMGGESNPVYDYKIENLYAAITLVSGFPGLAILCVTYASAFFISVAYFIKKNLPYPARVMALCGAVGAFALIFNGNVQVNITQFHVMFLYMILMALVQFAVKPHVSIRGRVKVSPYLQAMDRAKASSALASLN